jgi:hypothetical protein
MDVDDPVHNAGWAALIADVLGRPGRRTVLSALERPLRTDTYRLLESAWAGQADDPTPGECAARG